MTTKYLVQSGADNVTTFTTIYQWLASLPATLTAPETLEIAGDFSYQRDAINAENLSGPITSAANYLRIYVPPQYRHDGRPRSVSGKGFRITDSSQFAIAAKHARLEGVELDIAAVTALNILSGASSDVRIDGCLIKNNATDTNYTVLSTAAGNVVTMDNTIVYGSSRSLDSRGSASFITKHSFFLRFADNIGVVCNSEFKAYNAYSGKAAGATADWLTGGTPVGTNNASSDGTATTLFQNSFNSIAPASVLASFVAGTVDFKLKPGTNALRDTGSASNGLSYDASGGGRPRAGGYDIGPFESPVPFTDSFTGTAGTKLDTRVGWAQIGSGWGPQIPEVNGSNQLKAAAANDDVPLVGQNAGSVNHYVQANVYAGFQYSGVGAFFPQLMVRASTRRDAIGVAYSVGSGWQIVNDSSGVMQTVAGTFTPGMLLRVEAEGGQIRVYGDGTLIMSQTISDHLTNTSVGVIAGGSPGADPVLDNYESGVIAAATKPGAVTNVVATAGYEQVSVAFTAPASDPRAPTTGFTATWSPGGQSVSGSSSPLVITGVAANVAGSATVTATNNIGTSDPSAASNSVTPMAATPDAPTNLVATAGVGYADVAFTLGALKGHALTGVTVTASTGETATGTTSPIRVNVPGGTALTFTATQTTDAGSSPASAPSNSVTPTVPTIKPTGVFTKVQADGDSVIIEIDTTGTPNGGTVSLPIDPLTPNGAVAQAAINLAFTAGKATATFNNVPAGNYAKPVASVSNAAGSNNVTGGNTVSIVDVTMPVPTAVTGVSVTPATANVSGGGTANFAAQVTGTGAFSPNVTWQASAGSITSAGVFTAPAATASQQDVVITATSVTDPTQSGVAAVTVTAGVSTVTGVTVSPANPQVQGGASQQFSAVVAGAFNPSQAVTWTTTAGAIDASGNFTAPAATNTSQQITVTATSVQNGTKKGTSTVTVPALGVQPPTITGVTVSPNPANLSGTTQQFSAAVVGTNNPSQQVTWASDLGTISSSGLLTVVQINAVQTGTVTATSTLDNTKQGTAAFTVAALAVTPPPDPDPVVGATTVEMQFLTPAGAPVAGAFVEIQLGAADTPTDMEGIMMPRLLAMNADDDGQLTVDLLPCDTPYFLTVYDSSSDAGLSYRFFVPQAEVPGQPVRLQDIIVDGTLAPSFDEAALQTIIQAKASVMAARQEILDLVDNLTELTGLGGPDGASLVGYKTGTVADALDAGTGGGNGGGGLPGDSSPPPPTGTSGNRPEVLLVPDANGVLTPDGLISNRFRFILTADTKLGNPKNFYDNEHIYLTGYQDTAGQHKLTYGLDYMFTSNQPFTPPQTGNAAFLIELRPTQNLVSNSLSWALWGYPDNKTAPNGFSLVTAIATKPGSQYYSMSSALAAMVDGDVLKVVRNGLSAEATGALTGTDPQQVFYVQGVPVASNISDPRPLLQLLTVDYDEGPPRGANRPAYGKAIMNAEGKGKVYYSDLRVTGARNYTNNAHGFCNNADGMTMVLRNIEITDCNNGVLNGNQGMTGDTELYDVLIDRCGVGGPDPENSHGSFSSAGFTHSAYFGHNNATIRIARVTMSNSVNGDNLKCRTGSLYATQLLCTGAAEGRELEIPNGGVVDIDNSAFIKPANSNNGHLVIMGANGGAVDTPEGLDTTRPRMYRFVNCLFKSDYSVTGQYAGRDGFLVCHLDPNVPIEFVDCKFEGELASSNADDPNGKPVYIGTVTEGGIRFFPSARPIFTYTGGPGGTVSGPTRQDNWTHAPLGPVKPVGYFPVPMTPAP